MTFEGGGMLSWPLVASIVPFGVHRPRSLGHWLIDWSRAIRRMGKWSGARATACGDRNAPYIVHTRT